MNTEKIGSKALFAAMMGANLAFVAVLAVAIHFESFALGIAGLALFYWVSSKLNAAWKSEREARESKASPGWLLLAAPLAGIMLSQLIIGPMHYPRFVLFLAACLAVVGFAMFERSRWYG